MGLRISTELETLRKITGKIIENCHGEEKGEGS
jgi:hypothetical protein